MSEWLLPLAVGSVGSGTRYRPPPSPPPSVGVTDQPSQFKNSKRRIPLTPCLILGTTKVMKPKEAQFWSSSLVARTRARSRSFTNANSQSLARPCTRSSAKKAGTNVRRLFLTKGACQQFGLLCSGHSFTYSTFARQAGPWNKRQIGKLLSLLWKVVHELISERFCQLEGASPMPVFDRKNARVWIADKESGFTMPVS